MVPNKAISSIPAFHKTRIAPTPSGYLHVGNVLSFATTAALAEKSGAKILLRIDDLDRERVEFAYVMDIFDTLNFLEIQWHEGPRSYEEYKSQYSQIHRLPLYESVLAQLWKTGKVFACTCSRTQILSKSASGIYPGTCRDKHLPPDTQNACWRLRTEANKVLQMNTLQGIVDILFPAEMTDFVVRKKDGYPAYQLSSIIDDVHFGIDLVVRGEDLLHSTVAQLYLAGVLERPSFLQTTFYHHPLVSGAGGLKLSKSAGATSIQYLRNEYKTRTTVLKKIGEMLGVKVEVNNWKDLVILLGNI